VKTVALDSFLREIPKVPLIIKIDVEGHEIYVLEGMKGIIEAATDLMFFIEFNPDSLKSAGFRPEELLEKIDQLGFDIYFIDDEGRETYKVRQEDFGNWKRYFGEVNFKKNYFNLLCQRKQKSLSVCFFSHSAQLLGAEKCLLDLTIDLIRDYGVNCTVILPEEGPLRQKLHHVGASTVVANYSWWCDLNLLSNREVNLRLCEGFTRVALHIRQKLEKMNPDVIFTNTLTIPWGAIIALILDKPHLWFIHEFCELDHDLKFFLPFETISNIIRDASNLKLAKENFTKEEFSGELYRLLKNLKDTKNPCSADLSRFMANLMSYTLDYIEAALKGNNAFTGTIFQQIDELKGELTSIHNSWSWKITKPLRKIYAMASVGHRTKR
jgi:hypothetical protein